MVANICGAAVMLLIAGSALPCQPNQCIDSDGACFYCPSSKSDEKDGKSCWTVTRYVCVRGKAASKASCGKAVDLPSTTICQAKST